MKVNLKSLTLINFKGIKNLAVSFGDQTNIFGDNATGKTTIFDAFVWLMFGKDSSDRKDFNIKTLDSNNNALHKLEHEVLGVLEVDGSEVILKRTFREKWVKKRGSEETEFTGHETLFYFNDVPCQAGEYQSKVNNIINEDIFKLITNPLYFNSLKWQDRRNVLLKIVGNVSDNDIANLKPEFQSLMALLSNKSLEEFKREIAAKKKKLKDDLQAIPTRIDESFRSIPEEPDYNAIQAEISATEKLYKEAEDKIADASKVSQSNLEAIQKRQQEVYSLKSQLQKIEFDHSSSISSINNKRLSEVNNLKQRYSSLKGEYDNIASQIPANVKSIETLNTKVASLRDEWTKENEKELVFDDHEFTCPACKRLFETEDIETKKEEMISNFNKNKLEKLAFISNEGKSIKEQISKIQVQIDSDQNKISGLYRDVESIDIELKKLAETPLCSDSLESNTEYVELKAKILALESSQVAVENKIDTSELIQQKAVLYRKLDELKAKLTIKAVIEKAKARIEELKSEEKKLAQQLSDLEKQEFVITDFTKAKIDAIEQKINQLFNFVKFKMFETQINGGEIECCECLVDGVPWSDANNAKRINAGLDIIKALCKHYDVTAPVFCDNAESVNQLIALESQLIRLVVSYDKQLKVA